MTAPRKLPVVTVSPAEAAQIMGVSRDHIYGLIESNLIASAKSGTRVLVFHDSILDYLESVRRPA